MYILDKIYFKVVLNLTTMGQTTLKVGQITHKAETSDAPDFTPLVNYIVGYGGILLTAILGLVSIWLTYNIVRIGFRIAAASRDGDVEGRSQAIKEIGWQLVAFTICFSAAAVAGTFAGIFLNK